MTTAVGLSLVRWRRWLAVAVFILTAAAVVVVSVVWLAMPGHLNPDGLVYLAAGARLNAGHALYHLSPGDQWIPFGTPQIPAPLLSPPLSAVLSRPLAALPEPWGLAIWLSASTAAFVAAVAFLARRAPGWTGLTLGALILPVVMQVTSLNVNGFVLLGVLGAWAAHRSHPRAVGASLAVLVAVKLLPIFVVWWLLWQRSWAALRAFGVVIVFATLVSLAGAGLQAHVEYLALRPAVTPIGLAILPISGSALLPWVVAFVALAGVPLTARRPELSWAFAIAGMVVGTPAVNVHTYALALAFVAPLAWRCKESPDQFRADVARGVSASAPAP